MYFPTENKILYLIYLYSYIQSSPLVEIFTSLFRFCKIYNSFSARICQLNCRQWWCWRLYPGGESWTPMPPSPSIPLDLNQPIAKLREPFGSASFCSLGSHTTGYAMPSLLLLPRGVSQCGVKILGEYQFRFIAILVVVAIPKREGGFAPSFGVNVNCCSFALKCHCSRPHPPFQSFHSKKVNFWGSFSVSSYSCRGKQ